MKKTTISLRFNENLLKEIDDYADSVNVSRTAAITFIVSNYLKSLQSMDTMRTLTQIYENERKEKEVAL